MIEPTADTRVAAVHLRQMFVALVQQGFTNDQALTLLGHMMVVNASRPDN